MVSAGGANAVTVAGHGSLTTVNKNGGAHALKVGEVSD
jgi:hypothetical protein